jgi:hypothetical protein
MKLLSTCFFISSALAATSFTLTTLSSTPYFRFSPIYVKNDRLLIGSDDAAEFILNDDKTLVDKNTGKYITIADGNFLTEADESIRKFDIQDNFHLVRHIITNQDFYGCYLPDGTFGVKVEKCSAGSPIELKVNGAKEVDNFYPHKSSTLVTKTVTPPPEQPTKPTEAPQEKPTKTPQEKPTKAPQEKPTKAPAQPSELECSFGLIAIHSGSNVQNAPIKKVDSHLHVFSVGGSEGKAVTLTLKEDGSLVDQDGVGIFVDPNTGEFGDINPNPWGTEKPVTGFSLKDGHLLYQGKDNWSACPSAPDKYSLANNNCIGGTSIVLKVVR